MFLIFYQQSPIRKGHPMEKTGERGKPRGLEKLSLSTYMPILDEQIREKLILPAAKFVPYNLSQPKKSEQSEGQVKVILELYKEQV